MAGIIRYGSYVPFFRIQRSSIGGGRGERAVASYDEDAVSMAVEAGREAMRGVPAVDTLLFATTSPPYAEKLNAAAIGAALALPGHVRSMELGACTRVGLSALLLGADLAASAGKVLVCASDVMVGAPGGPRESQGGDAAVAFVLGDDASSIARVIGRAHATTELLDVWRLPGERFPRQWEERFGETVLGPVVIDTAKRALAAAGVDASTLKGMIIDSPNARVAAGLPGALKLTPEQLCDSLDTSVGKAGAAYAGLLLARALDTASAGDRYLVLSVADGCDAAVLETTSRIAEGRPQRSVDGWIAAKRSDLSYLVYMKWRGVLPFEPPRRPDPQGPAAPPMRRHERWKMAFVGSRCRGCDTRYVPPQRVCLQCHAVDQMDDISMADQPCEVRTFTLDNLAYSLQPPVVAAIVDYRGGGRLPCELTDVEPTRVAIGDQLEMTFRRMFTGQGVHNYFWKARPRR